MHSLSTAVLPLLVLLAHTSTTTASPAGAAAAASTIIVDVTITAPAPGASSTSFTNDAAFQNDVLSATNFYRSEQGSAPLTWNETSANFGQNYANGCAFKHSGGPTGENLAAGYANASASVDAWGLEREMYNYNKPGFSEATGHFTQLVWSNTTSVGCGRTACFGKNNTPGYYVVCEYWPPGNVEGDNNQYFIDNVKKQDKGKATDTVESGVTSRGTALADTRWGIAILAFAVVLGWSLTC